MIEKTWHKWFKISWAIKLREKRFWVSPVIKWRFWRVSCRMWASLSPWSIKWAHNDLQLITRGCENTQFLMDTSRQLMQKMWTLPPYAIDDDPITVLRNLSPSYKPFWRPQRITMAWRYRSIGTLPNPDETDSHRWFIVRNHIKTYPVSSRPSRCRLSLNSYCTVHGVCCQRSYMAETPECESRWLEKRIDSEVNFIIRPSASVDHI